MEDEETVQTKAWNYFFEVLRLRGLVEGEMAHPLWNCFKRSFRDVGLDTSVLKLTILANFGHGSFTNGDKTFVRREFLSNYMQKTATEDMLATLAENLSFDRGISDFAFSPEDVAAMLDSFMDAKTIGTRGKFVAFFKSYG